ncbi:MAG: PDZ domain-containing protein [Anaerolineales bacterium]|nr:PDZ domain-containing protein [Anaerolineales bacterium]
MKIKRFSYVLLIITMLACNFVTSRFTPSTATPPPPTLTATVEQLQPAYIPESCQNVAIATIPPATALVQPTAELQVNPEVPQDLQQKVFDDAVDIIEQVYVYPDFNGNDWPAIVAKYQAKIDEGLDTESFYREMLAMVIELGDDHSYFESPLDVAQSEADLAGNNEFVGVGIYVQPQLDKNQVTVISIFPDSPAEHGGLKAHDSILAIDGLPIVDDGVNYIYLARGPECSATTLTVKSPGEEPRDVLLVRQRIQSPLLIDARLVPTTDGSRIGYIFIPTFYDQTIPGQIEDALNNFGPLDGLILDNRLNGGGSSDVLEPILSFFTSGNLGQFVSREDSRPLQIEADPIQNSQDVPLIVLVSEETVSFGEVFSGAVKDNGRAKIVGQTSLGNVEVLHGYDFDDDSRIWIAQETFDPPVSEDNWEETGIVPDVEAHADWDTFIFETDPAIAAALSLLGHE